MADIDGDGDPDMIVGSLIRDFFAVLLNNGSGGFGAPTPYMSGGQPSASASGDFNGDGLTDVVVACSRAWQNSSQLSVHLNVGDGVLRDANGHPHAEVTSGTPHWLYETAAGDLNGDGYPDLATVWANSDVDGAMRVQLNNGDGTMAAPQDYPRSTEPQSVRIADLNGDGRSDVVVGNIGNFDSTNTVSIYFNTGAGQFLNPTEIPSGGGNTYAIDVADVDGDSDLDIVALNSYFYATGQSSNLTILINNGTGGFSTGPVYSFTPSNRMYEVLAADMDADGDADLFVSSSTEGNVRVLRNNGSGAFTQIGVYAVEHRARKAALGDLNGDGVKDLVVAIDSYEGVLSHLGVFMGLGGGTFGSRADYSHPYLTETRGVVAGDLDQDGDLDVAITTVNSILAVFENPGNGSLLPAVFYGAGRLPTDLVSDDFDLDGRPDLAVVNQVSSCVTIMLNRACTPAPCPADINGDHTVNTADLTILLGQFGQAVAPNTSGDLNGDGAVNTLDLTVLLGAFGMAC